jgi:hypothetical protein
MLTRRLSGFVLYSRLLPSFHSIRYCRINNERFYDQRLTWRWGYEFRRHVVAVLTEFQYQDDVCVCVDKAASQVYI